MLTCNCEILTTFAHVFLKYLKKKKKKISLCECFGDFAMYKFRTYRNEMGIEKSNMAEYIRLRIGKSMTEKTSNRIKGIEHLIEDTY